MFGSCMRELLLITAAWNPCHLYEVKAHCVLARSSLTLVMILRDRTFTQLAAQSMHSLTTCSLVSLLGRVLPNLVANSVMKVLSVSLQLLGSSSLSFWNWASSSYFDSCS